MGHTFPESLPPVQCHVIRKRPPPQVSGRKPLSKAGRRKMEQQEKPKLWAGLRHMALTFPVLQWHKWVHGSELKVRILQISKIRVYRVY